VRIKDLSKFVLVSGATIYKALETINNNFCEVVFIEGSNKTIIGVITDGDIRRGLLRRLDLQVPVTEIMSRNFISVTANASRADALDLMKARGVKQLPILGVSGELVGVHLLTELIGAHEIPNAALIMAGGRGTRLGALTAQCPKPMLNVAGRPILEESFCI
jgi:predicted transcriptional regulator